MILSSFWKVVLALLLSIAWLIPNHTLPWLGFHGDAWIAIVLSAVFLLFCVRVNFNFSFGSGFYLWMSLAALPIIQFFFGQIRFFGTAWINSIYILAFFVSIGLAASWRAKNDTGLVDLIYVAIVFSCLVSVFIELMQLLSVEYLSDWVLYGPPNRQYANLAQPNQLSSLLLLGFVGLGWLHFRRLIGIGLALPLAFFFLLGVALTESRTAWLVLISVCSLCVWRRQVFESKKYIICILLLIFAYTLMVLSVESLYKFLNIDAIGGEVRSISKDPRWQAWTIFFKAAALHPFFGFGFGQNGIAQFAVLDYKIVLGGSYLQSHNLFLDMALWCGFPIAGLLSFLILRKLFYALIRIDSFEKLVLMASVLVLFIHAMLEYPLQYAYFLLPFGVFVGTYIGVGRGALSSTHRSYAGTLMVVLCIGSLSVTIVDYMRVERQFYGLRFELKKIATDIPAEPPKVIALTQWRENVRVSRFKKAEELSADDLEVLRDVTLVMPSAFLMSSLAAALAAAGAKEEAFKWLNRVCQTSPPEHCRLVKEEWLELSKNNSNIRDVKFPSY